MGDRNTVEREGIKEETFEKIKSAEDGRVFYHFFKRTLDIVVSSLAIIVLFVPSLVISFFVYRQDKHSPFYGQTRIGKEGKPFKMWKFRSMIYNADEVLKKNPELYQKYLENNFKLPEGEDPRITKIGAFLRKTSLDEIPQFLNVFMGQMSLIGPRPIVKKELVKNAILSVLLSMIGIIIYIALRFKLSYAVAAVTALVHDVLIIFALFSIFNLEISVMFIAAILAIIGYSINDTIVCFDRIRENIKEAKNVTKDNLADICNESIRETFSRTIYTSITTLLPVIALIVLGSSGILTFNLAMLFGLISGTYSSLFIATVLFIKLEKKNLGKPKKKKRIYTDEFNEKKVKGVNC